MYGRIMGSGMRRAEVKDCRCSAVNLSSLPLACEELGRFEGGGAATAGITETVARHRWR